MSPVRMERAGAVAVAVLDQPATLNRLTPALQQALRQHVEALREEPAIRALVVTGEGKAFCAGADLDAMGQGAQAGESLGQRTARIMREVSNPLMHALRSLHIPVLVAVNGVAVGGGAGLALAGDVVLMARSASLLLPSMPRLGIVPDLGATWLLERLAGRSRALAMSLLGERIGAEDAVRFGLAWACVEDADLRAHALRLAERLARLPRDAAPELRAAFEAAARQGLQEQLAYEADRQEVLIDRPAFAEGVRAFLAKREPDFGHLP